MLVEAVRHDCRCHAYISSATSHCHWRCSGIMEPNDHSWTFELTKEKQAAKLKMFMTGIVFDKLRTVRKVKKHDIKHIRKRDIREFREKQRDASEALECGALEPLQL